ncbi:hypothetical protein FO519_000891 [Halicephalobus sp. NKZ332]|nr:hypothetical protein FO519_000891 [Halicephalobus sp. NKZ332]
MWWRNCILPLTVALLAVLILEADGAIFRLKRQTVVSSNANSSGVADTVETSGAAHNYKTIDGIIGVNASAAGNATGQNSATMDTNANGSAGDKSVGSVGNVQSSGTNSNAYSNIQSAISGGNMSVQSNQQGNANGVGDTSAAANGNAVMNQGGVDSPMNSKNSQATAGASGSLSSSSEVVLSQTLTWSSILAQLVGSAVAQGVYNAQANIDLGAGNAENGVEVNGVVSGVNDGGGLVNSQVNGNGMIDNEHHQLTGNMYGTVNGTGNTTLVGATNLQSNNSEVNQTISAFGDSKVGVDPDAQSGANLLSNTNLDNQGAINGEIGINATANSGNKNMTVSNGLQLNNGSDGLLAMGNGGVLGSGNVKSNASLTSDTKYNGNNDADVLVNADGSSASNNNQGSGLQVNANSNLWNTNGVAQNGTAAASGAATGENTNMTGNAFVNSDSINSNGNAAMDVQAGGQGPSSALTSGVLNLKDATNNARNATVQGSVAASGDQTQVRSISVITDYAGMQSLSNYQNATSRASGSSSSSASNVGVLKRRKRQIAWLSDKIIARQTEHN